MLLQAGQQRANQLTPQLQLLLTVVMVLAVSYQALLCFVNTNIFAASRGLVGITETLIMLLCIPLLRYRISLVPLLLILVCGAMISLLSLINPQTDIKAFRDLLIPIWFFAVGYNLGREDIADKILAVIVAWITLWAFFELFFLDTFTTILNIADYYTNLGALLPITDYERDSNLQLNGMRPEGIGRTFLPWLLGPHRVSSVFLEPVSLGNFATVLVAWGLSKSRDRRSWAIFFITTSMVLIILADSRFSLLTIPLLFATRFLLSGNQYRIAVLMPAVAIIGLLIVAKIYYPLEGDDYLGRLVISGNSLIEFDISNILGTPGPHYYGDQGYAYVLSNFGLPLCLLLWGAFWMAPTQNNPASEKFRAFMAIYLCLILCVSGNSAFAMKSSALLWFLFGCSLNNGVFGGNDVSRSRAYSTSVPALNWRS